MLTIYHTPRTRSLRIVWLCEEMELPYQVQIVPFRAPTAEYLGVNPLGGVPALTDGDVTMIESIAIMQYIMGKYGPTELALLPNDFGYAKYLQYLQFGESGLAMYGNPLVATHFSAPEDQRSSWTVQFLKDTVVQRLKFVEQQLADGPFITGSRFTASDISLGYAVGVSEFLVGSKPSPTLQAYQDRLTARPAYQRALLAV
jgi:glutathione S-transferase